MGHKIAVLGAGSWGSALAGVLFENGHTVSIWTRDNDQKEEINNQHTNKKYLPQFSFPEDILASTDLKEAVTGAEALLFVIPTKGMRAVAKQVNALIDHKVTVIHASKGLEEHSHKRISTILSEELVPSWLTGIVALSGPSHAEEVIKKDLTTITAASETAVSAQLTQELFINDYFRVYTNSDIVGVEIGAALKNIIAIGAGVIAGLGYGDNAKAGLVTRGLAEISRLGIELGADPLTFMGLSGVGDLIVTCTSPHSRNWRAGYQIGKGKEIDSILSEMGMVVEGISTTRAAFELAASHGIEMPITEAIYNVVYNDSDVEYAILNLMQREGKSE
ncbi:NAD(P)H-dependent glycerol-3-phosphate dehydrogenase [Alkalibacterium olivapovliticus]|uniref:Glycerol-3-phosphate dehydrogenase [NAD(P)+] n=1 Tax=Alkalibacterium olivapovliticus TaxID=99907 RepID=A0A2T0W9Y8_9LACT|nr:NAD(P)H-dependent glycerol-3-phosphate dehydrogenase [Alkalibacterium olivapovliticus]PRY83507.1 glycerol-3-phosphate dehydrogenase (NAD(P)+) [Alkalibacterium olivapovliticus]